MNKTLLLAASFMLAAICTTAQEHTLAWRNLGIKVNYATSFSFSRDQLPTTLDWNKPNYSTFRLGLSYDWQREQTWSYNINLSIDWYKDNDKNIINDPNFNLGVISIDNSYGGSVYFTLETQFLYQLSANKKLHAMIAPQINYFLHNDDGLTRLRTNNNVNNYSFSLINTEKNRLLRPSLAVGLQYDIAPKSRLGVFYSHSFTPIVYGEYRYSNSNGDTITGDWEFKGHQIGLSFQFFPFRKK